MSVAARAVTLDGHRVGCGDLLDADFQRELWTGAPSDSGLCLLDWPYNAAIDKDAAVRSKKAGMRNGKNTCITEAWDTVYNEEGGGGWEGYSKDLDLWLEACRLRRAKNSPIICWGWSLSMPYVIAAGERHGLQLVTIYTWAKPTASPRFAKNCIITKSCEFAAIFRGRAKLDVFPPLIREQFVYSPQRSRGDTAHQSPKPLVIFQALIERFAAPGSVVFDPFAGSFTTLIACRASGRVAVAADREEWCYREGLKRYGSRADGLLAGSQPTLWSAA